MVTTKWKKVIAASLVGVCVLFVGCWEGHHYNPTRPHEGVFGSGNVVQESRPVSGFTGLRLVGVGEVEIVQGGSEGLIVEAEDNLLPYLRTEVSGGVLVISNDHNVNLHPTRPIVFHVNALVLDSVDLSGVGNIRTESLTSDRLVLWTTGVGHVDFSNVSIRELEVSVSGVGNVAMSGSAQTQRVTLTGVGSYEGRGLDTSIARVDVHAVGSATVRVSDRLDANVVGPGCVYYIGNPVVTDGSFDGTSCIRKIN